MSAQSQKDALAANDVELATMDAELKQLRAQLARLEEDSTTTPMHPTPAMHPTQRHAKPGGSNICSSWNDF